MGEIIFCPVCRSKHNSDVSCFDINARILSEIMPVDKIIRRKRKPYTKSDYALVIGINLIVLTTLIYLLVKLIK